MTRKLVAKTACMFGDPNCSTRYYDNGDIECVMYRPADCSGTLIKDLTTLADTKLHGVQLPLRAVKPTGPLAYRAVSHNGSLVLCDRHLDTRRVLESWRLTGESFPAAACDDCKIENGKEPEL